jgi:hypothetical protein
LANCRICLAIGGRSRTAKSAKNSASPVKISVIGPATLQPDSFEPPYSVDPPEGDAFEA